jgi:enoyl-CoA hydratase
LSDEVVVERNGPVQVITINRPEARNALTAEVSRRIADAVDELDASPNLHVGVLTGAGGTFCSGMDLKGFLRGERASLPGRGLGGITTTPPSKPLVAAVEGWAVAGGFELLLACDLVVAAEGAMFGLPEVKRGLVAAAGGAIGLSRRVSPSLAMEMLLLGDTITAARAASGGLVNRVVPDGSALREALAMASQIAENGPLAVAASKELVRGSDDLTLPEAREMQARLVKVVFDSDDAMEGARAFAEKRAPRWQGR